MDEADALRLIDSAIGSLPSAMADATTLESVIEATEAAVAVTQAPEARRNAFFVLGMLYEHRQPGNKADNLEKAIHHLTEALALTEEDDPIRDMFLHNLGKVYKDRIAGSRADNLEQAIRLLEAALESSSRDDHPAEWATTASQLANMGTPA